MSAPGLRDILLILLVAVVASGGGRLVGRQLRRLVRRQDQAEGEPEAEPERLRPVAFVVSAMAVAWLLSQLLIEARAHH